MKHMDCIVDGHNGIYVGQAFAEKVKGSVSITSLSDNIDVVDTLTVLEAGPNHPEYLDAWMDAVDFFVLSFEGDPVQYQLWQEDDLFIVDPELLEED